MNIFQHCTVIATNNEGSGLDGTHIERNASSNASLVR